MSETEKMGKPWEDWKTLLIAGTAMGSLTGAALCFVAYSVLHKYGDLLVFLMLTLLVIAGLATRLHFQNLKNKKLPSALSRGKFRFFDH